MTIGVRLKWRRRPRIEDLTTARRRIWVSACGRWRVVESTSKYGLSTIYYAQRRDERWECWDTISMHRKRPPAMAACERDAKARA